MKKLMLSLAGLFTCASLSFASASFADDSNLFDCNANPGRRLCLNMNRAGSYIQTCEGGACNVLFSKYVRSLDTFTDEYLDEFLPTDKFEVSVGDMANKLAHKICDYEITGEESLIRAVAAAENRALEQLKIIQEQSSVVNVKSCVIVIEN